MDNNSQDKGYITVYIKDAGDKQHLCEMGFTQNPDEKPFYVDYENGTIFIDTDDEKSIIGRYEAAPDPYGFMVYDYPSNRIIGHVGDELIYFRRNDADASVGRHLPEENCLAYYTKAGSITPTNNLLKHYGIIQGSKIGGAAAFVALFYSYRFESIFRDYFVMDKTSFDTKYDSYLNYVPGGSISASQFVQMRLEDGINAIRDHETYDTTLKALQSALDASLMLTQSSEEDLATRREIYRYLGFAARHHESSQKVYSYFQKGLPISECDDEEVLYAYLVLVNSMRGQSEYGIAFCHAVEDVYHNAFDKITNMDYKASILRWVVREKCGIYKKPRDIAGAEQINARLLQYALAQEQGTLTCQHDLRKLYNDNLTSIGNARHAVQQSTYSTTSYSSASHYTNKSFWRKAFPFSFGTNSWAGVVGRILVYLLAEVIVGLVAGLIGQLPVLGPLISMAVGTIVEIYAIAGCVVTVLAHLGKIY